MKAKLDLWPPTKTSLQADGEAKSQRSFPSAGISSSFLRFA